VHVEQSTTAAPEIERPAMIDMPWSLDSIGEMHPKRVVHAEAERLYALHVERKLQAATAELTALRESSAPREVALKAMDDWAQERHDYGYTKFKTPEECLAAALRSADAPEPRT
jgi:hypothetical protein